MPTQIYIFSVGINTYTLCIGLALLAGMVVALWPLRASHERRSQALTGWLVIAGMTMAAGRAGYVLLHLDYFSEHVQEVISAASPGIWEHAAIVGAVVGWWIVRRVSRPVSGMALVVSAGLIGIGASLGCIPHGCAYGREVFWTEGWTWALRADWPDAYTVNNPRLPTQVFMIIWLLSMILVIAVRKMRAMMRQGMSTRNGTTYASSLASYDGVVFEATLIIAWVVLFAVGDFAIQFVRADVQPTINGWRWSQCADMVLLVASILSLIVVKIRLSTVRR